jgi:hypothetical protein
MITFLFSYGLNAQVKIHEKIEIAPRASVNALVQSSDLSPSFSCTVPYNGCGVLWIVGFDNCFEGDATLQMNGSTIVPDIYDQVFGLWDLRIDLGNLYAGENLTFTLLHGGGSPWLVQECGNEENSCESSHSVIFTHRPICGQIFEGGFPC